jgi:hypothetical protein
LVLKTRLGRVALNRHIYIYIGCRCIKFVLKRVHCISIKTPKITFILPKEQLLNILDKFCPFFFFFSSSDNGNRWGGHFHGKEREVFMLGLVFRKNLGRMYLPLKRYCQLQCCPLTAQMTDNTSSFKSLYC